MPLVRRLLIRFDHATIEAFEAQTGYELYLGRTAEFTERTRQKEGQKATFRP
jgi:hypothetical protein